mgnify:CR=1 FL=1
MSEQEKMRAVAKVKTKIYRRLLTAMIVAPVFICAALTILAPTFRDNLAQREVAEFCGTQIPMLDTIQPYTIPIVETDDASSDIAITADNIAQLRQVGETIVDIPSAQLRGYEGKMMHPNGDYIIFAEYTPSESTNFFICGIDETALGAFSADESAGDVIFNADGSLFAVTERSNAQIMLFDANAIARAGTITVDEREENSQLYSITFHPTEPLLFFTVDGDLIVYNTDTMMQIYRATISESLAQAQISFNADGTLLLMINTLTNIPTASIWGIGD